MARRGAWIAMAMAVPATLAFTPARPPAPPPSEPQVVGPAQPVVAVTPLPAAPAAPAAPAPDAPKADAKPPEAKPADAKEGAEKPAEKTPAGTALATAVKVAETMKAARPTGAAGAGAPAAAAGSAVYRISPDGLVTPLLGSRDEMILALAVSPGRLLVGTGKNGRVYEVMLASNGDEQACIATIDPKQVMALAVTLEGKTIVGSSGPGRLYALSKGFRKEGTYTSQVYDAGGSARWGTLDWRGQTPDGTEVRLATRSGNVRDPKKGMWSDWSKETAKPPAEVGSPAARFLQFRVTMKTNKDDSTAVLDQFEAAYLRANEPPKITAITEVLARDAQGRAEAVDRFRQMMKGRSRNSIKPPPSPPPQAPPPEGSQPVRILQWQAQDPNGDELRYDVYFRGQGEATWILLEQDLVRPEYAWDTATVADGWYEIKIVASDRADHPAEMAREDWRVSDPVLVDNSGPVIGKIEVKIRGGEADVLFTAQDSASRLTEAAYTIDSAAEWQTLAPTDGLFDGRQKEFRFTIRNLTPGSHRLGLRVIDEAHNRGHAAQALIVAK